MVALIQVKRELFLEEIDAVDGRDLMNPEASKWVRVSQHVMQAGHSPCMQDGPACKAKWNQLIRDYKRIADFHACTGRNVPEYWELSSLEHSAENLPRNFSQDLYAQIHEWFGQRPQIQPPHVRDLLATHDGNHPGVHVSQQVEDDASGDSEAETENVATIEASDSQPMQSPPSNLRQPSQPLETGVPGELHRSGPSRAPLSPSVTHTSPTGLACGPSSGRMLVGPISGQPPMIISSSDTSEFSSRQRPGNTGVRRKSLSSHNVIAEATKASGEVMAMQMRDMAAASRDLKRSKIEVQLKLFSEQMDYQREKDRRLYESSLIANKNTRLAIIKQGEVVSCLAQLSSVLQMGLNVSSQGNRGGVPQSTATTGASVEAKSNAPAAPTSTLSFSPSAALGPTTAPDTCAADAPPQC
jgi:hypothetical protein